MTEPQFHRQLIDEDLTEVRELLLHIANRRPVLAVKDTVTQRIGFFALTRYTGDAGILWHWDPVDGWRQFRATNLGRFGMADVSYKPGADRANVFVKADTDYYRHLRATRKDLI